MPTLQDWEWLYSVQCVSHIIIEAARKQKRVLQQFSPLSKLTHKFAKSTPTKKL